MRKTGDIRIVRRGNNLDGTICRRSRKLHGVGANRQQGSKERCGRVLCEGALLNGRRCGTGFGRAFRACGKYGTENGLRRPGQEEQDVRGDHGGMERKDGEEERLKVGLQDAAVSSCSDEQDDVGDPEADSDQNAEEERPVLFPEDGQGERLGAGPDEQDEGTAHDRHDEGGDMEKDTA